MKVQSSKFKNIIISILTILISLVAFHTGIFWDNTTFVTAMGNALYENGIFAWGSIPVQSDPGHPPFIATIMAVSWKILGRSLQVSHAILIPFIFGVMWQVWNICEYFIKERKLQIMAFFLMIADATFLSQMTLVTTEIPLIFFFFLSLNAMLRRRYMLMTFAIAFLGIVSLRGMMMCAGLFIIDIFLNRKKILLYPYIIGAIPAVLFITWRLLSKGWIIDNPANNWGSAMEYHSLSFFLKNSIWNTAVIGHILLDFGRIVPLLFIIIALFIRQGWRDEKCRKLLIIAFCSTSVVALISIFIINTIGHRYFTVTYILLSLLAFMMLQKVKTLSSRGGIFIYVIMLISLLAGNFIIYPDKIAQGWDSTLAQLHYWNVRRDMINYIDKNNIEVKNTASFFPNDGEIDAVDLNGDHRQWAQFTGNEQYVFYSNVFNLSDEKIDLIHNNYRLIQSYSSFGVRTELYKK